MSSVSDPSKPLDEYIAEYLQAVGRGRLPDPTGLLERSEQGRVEFLQTVRVVCKPPARRSDCVSRTTAGVTRIDRGSGDTGAGDTSRSPSSVIRSLRAGPPEAIADYDVLRELGRGGMGIVYLARHRQTGQRVALKVLHTAICRDPMYRERLRRESLAHAALRHDHIVGLIESGVDADGIPFLAMELVDGVGLDHLIRHLRSGDPAVAATAASAASDSPLRTPGSDQPIDRCLAPADRSQYLRWIVARLADVADALHLAHEQAMVHRDVKPSNILIDVDGKAWLSDFGLAALGDDTTTITATNDVLGTLAFMSPEQAQGARDQPLDRRSDIYSLGVTLYQATTLEKPFRGTRADVLNALLQGQYLPASRRNPAIPPELDVLIDRAMAFNPRDRYETAAEFAGELRRFAHGQRVQTRRPSLAQRAFRWCEKNPLIASLSAAAALLLVLAVLAVQTFNSVSIRRLNGVLERTNEDLASSHRALSRSERRLRRELYVADMAAAFEAFDNNDLPATRRILDRYRRPAHASADQRGAPWRLLDRLTRTVSHRVLARHGDAATEVALAADGTFGLSAGHDGMVRRFDLQADDQGERSAQAAHPFHIGDHLDALALLPSQAAFLTGRNVPSGYNPVVSYCAETGQRQAKHCEHWGSVEAVAVSPSGRWMASASRYHEVTVFDAQGTIRGQWESNSRNETLAFVDEDHLLVTAQRRERDREVVVWNVRTDEKETVRTPAAAEYFAISGNDTAKEPHGNSNRRLLATSKNDVWLLQWPSQSLLAELRDFGVRIRTLDITADGQAILVGSDEGIVFHWDLRDWTPNKDRRLPEPQVVQASDDRVTCVQFLDAGAGSDLSPSRTRFATTSKDGFVKLWDLPAESLSHWTTVAEHDGADVEQMFLDPADADGLYLAGLEGQVIRLDMRRRTSRVVCDLEQPIRGKGTLVSSRRRLYLPVAAGLAEIDLDAPAKVVRTLEAQDASGKCLGVVAVGDQLLACYYDHVAGFDLVSGRQTQRLALPDEAADRMLPHPDGRSAIVVGAEQGDLRVADGRVELWRENRVTAEMTSWGKFSSDGRVFASAHHDHSLRVQWLDGTRPPLRLSGHQDEVKALVFLDQDRVLASLATDNTLRFWDLATGRTLGTLKNVKDHNFLAVTPDQSQLVAGHDRGSFTFWDIQ
ncbi:WD40 repeat domain-containing serine/threonine-protein kinase [Roseimaritima sediminicola]|uniref:WD40 repeat domain-containing serine/threonine-protein kinase n=1 Tax=Roseimaritima sediminicola TaxID=2662066 RepID=UPI00129837C8|nr:serine/threonine-protein kinase [Roseimaritima sediminicola]